MMSRKELEHRLLLIILLIYTGSNGETTALHIDGSRERILSAGSTFLLSCSANETVSWMYPHSPTAQFSDSSKQTPSGYTSILTVESSDYLATGFYTCFGDHEEASVYVYVSDEENLLAVNPEDTMLLGHQYQDIIIPCKPTSPDVNVTLKYHDRPVKYSEYDPKIGFTVPNITLLDSGFVSCTASKNDKYMSEEFILSVNPHSKSAPQPEILEASIQRVVVGQDVTIHCFVKPEVDITFTVDWILPETANLSGRYSISKIIKHLNPSIGTEWEKTLTISPVYKTDEGNYTCRVWDHNNNTNTDTKYLKIYSHEDSFINISVQAASIEVDATLGESARWVVTVNAHPNVEISWYDPWENEIPRTMALSDKFQIRDRFSQTVLEIRNVGLQDAGNYTLVASNSGGKKFVNLELIVLDKPTVWFNSSGYYRINVPTRVSCFVDGYPIPAIHWMFRSCNITTREECSDFEMISAESYNITEVQVGEYGLESILVWNMREPGELSCAAENDKGYDAGVLPVFVTDVPRGFFMEKIPENIVEGDNLSLICGVTSYKYRGNRWWFVAEAGSNPLLLNESQSEPTKNYSYWSRVEIKNLSLIHSGNYTCTATEKFSLTNKEESISLSVLKAEAPEIQDTDLPNADMEISSWQPITWKCIVTGVPEPTVLWYKDNEILKTSDEFSSYELLDNNKTLSMKSLTAETEGNYTCRAKNRKGEVEAFVYLKLKDNQRTNNTLIITIEVVAVLLVIVLVSFIYALWKIAKEKKELRLAGLHNFEKGMTEAINPDLTLDQQTDSLPYDPKWEFPSSKLKLGKQLGAGAFGVVLKAEAYGIVEDEVWTTVAVKMVKRHADPAYIRALVSELKILAHLGKNLNVVNLLGACTKNYMKRELLVIVEFCKYGNAHNYLLSHRHKFVDQLDPVTGEIDLSKTSAIENYNRISVDSDPNSALVSYNTEMTFLSSERSATEEASLNSRNNPQWCANLQGDYKKYDLEELSTSTLICWSFQVARGMEYLASRRVLHGDLAARNVLIAENNIVKICDFGFAKNIYSHPEYQKTGDGPVPVKWMAIESITRRIFSTQSDVWSFGIVLWEFFSLAKTPYPGFENYESILTKLESGYRMEKPAYANQMLYEIMLECWDEQPCRRPSFSELVMKLGKLLESNVREHYIELNKPFQKETIPEGEDYLSMMSPPNYDPPTSHYVNEPVGKEAGEQSRNEDGYLCMRSSWNPTTPKGSNPDDSIEMRPMLSQQDKNQEENDDYLVPRKTPANTDCAFNPSYIMSSNVSGKKQPSNYGKINKT